MNTHSDVSDRPPDSPNNSSESQPKACPGRNDSFGGGRSLRNLWTSGLRQRQLGRLASLRCLHRKAAPEFEGSARQFRGQETDCDRRAIRRDKGAGCRLLALELRVAAGGNRMGQALSQSHARWIRDRDSAGVRGPKTLAPPARLNSASKRKDSAPSSSSGKARNHASQERIMK